MAQTYNDIPSTQTLTSSRQLILDRDEAVRTAFSGATSPANPVVGQFWFDSTNSLLYQCTVGGASPTWRQIPFGNPVALAQGGTGGTTASAARTNLGLGDLAVKNSTGIDVDLTQTSTGFLKLASGSDAQRPGTPAAGMIRYSTTQNAFEGYNGTQWQPVGSTTYNNMLVERFNGAGGAGNQNVTLASNPGSLNNVDVYISGVYQQKNQLSLSGTTLTVPAAPVGTGNIEVVYGVPLSIGTPADASVTTAKLVDSSVTTAKLADGAGTLAKLDRTGTSGYVLTAQGAGSAPVWAQSSGANQLRTLVFAPYTATASGSGGTMSASSEVNSVLPNGSTSSSIVLPAFAGSGSVSGTTLTVTAATEGALKVGDVVTTPAFAGTATNSGTTLTVATASAGGLQVGSVINTTASFTASRSGTTLTVTAVASGGIHVGMTIFNGATNIGTITAFGTGSGGNGTYTMDTSGTVSSGARTGTGTATISSFGTGAGGAGTYTINRTYTAISYSVTAAGAQKTVTALGTGAGSTGTYTVTPTGNTVAGSIGGNTTTTLTVTGGSAGSYTYTPNTLAFASQAVGASSFAWPCPTGITRVRATVVGAGGGGQGGNDNCSGARRGQSGGSGGTAYGEYTVVPGTVYTMTIGLGASGGNANGGVASGTGGTSSFASFCSATGGSGSASETGASGSGSGGTLKNVTGLGAFSFLTSGAGTSSQAGGIYSASSAAGAGGGGGFGGSAPGQGGMSGAVALEYVG